ncbi:MAG: hypothetical protein AAF282_14955 [Cyanobacteria bacterium P01_A01_bin.15]
MIQLALELSAQGGASLLPVSTQFSRLRLERQPTLPDRVTR